MIIYGASGHGKVICDIIHDMATGDDIVFIDDADKGNIFYNKPVFLANNYNIDNQNLIIAIGDNIIREQISYRFNNYFNAIHSSAIISKSVKIGSGVAIMQNVCCNADTIIGNHTILNTSCSIDHDCFIDNFVHISPNASIAGNVHIGKGTHVGIGSSIIQNVKIGKNVKIGAGAVVINDIPDGATVVGVPGKIIKIN